jgi:hypothetical protein
MLPIKEELDLAVGKSTEASGGVCAARLDAATAMGPSKGVMTLH